MASNTTTLKGSCLCGAVRYVVSGELRDVVNCHCSQCRRSHGHYAAYTAAPRDSIEFVDSEGLAWYQSSGHARRGFCKRCGSSLFWDLVGDAHLRIAAGSLDPPTGLRTSRHVYVEHKGDYYELDDELEKVDHSMLKP